MKTTSSAVMALLLCAAPLMAGEWPGWRGPRGDGTCEETDIPLRWSRGDNVAWKASVPGKGYSSPVVWGDRVFLTTCLEDEQKRVLLCFDRRDGKLLWDRVVLTAKLEKQHKRNSCASSTPVTDGKHVWVTFLDEPKLVVACYDFDGNQIWLGSPGHYVSAHGFCSSPVLYQDLVILNGDQDQEAYLAALEKATGKERWRTSRPNNLRSFSVPLVATVASRKQLLLAGSKSLASYDPDAGKQLWVVDTLTEKFVSSVVLADGVVFATGTSPEHLLIGVRPDGEGNVTKTHVLWRDTKGAAYVPSAVAHNKHIFLVTDAGVISCIEAKTGKRVWTERLGPGHSASPVAIGEHLFFVDDDGMTWVLKAGEKFEVVARNALEERCQASPAISHGQLFIRTMEHLYCIATTAPSTGRK